MLILLDAESRSKELRAWRAVCHDTLSSHTKVVCCLADDAGSRLLILSLWKERNAEDKAGIVDGAYGGIWRDRQRGAACT